MSFWKQNEKNIWVAAHRGWSAKYPENTMEAFRAAVEIGVDQIETDVRITKDGELVLIHDATVDRTTNGTGLVRDYTLKELQALDAGSHKGAEFSACRIPTLVELLELVKDHPTMTLDIEMKEYPEEDREAVSYAVCDRVIALLDAYGYLKRSVINTFSGKLQLYIREKYPYIRRHVYFPARCMGEYEGDPYKGAYCCCMFSTVEGEPMATAEEFEAMRAKGIQPWAGAAVKNAERVEMIIERGAPLVTCNNVDEILALLRERGYHK
ncbi:MAG: hypothetical protein IJC46_08615 [Clostridia bacterium]|nr:hypothetical protein [Clostridia bacterium]